MWWALLSPWVADVGGAPLSRAAVVCSLWRRRSPLTGSADELHAHFSSFGQVSDAIVLRDPGTGRSRGFGFVVFVAPRSVDAVLRAGSQHTLKGRQVEVKRAIARASANSNSNNNSNNSSSSSSSGGGGSGGGGGDGAASTSAAASSRGGSRTKHGASSSSSSSNRGRGTRDATPNAWGTADRATKKSTSSSTSVAAAAAPSGAAGVATKAASSAGGASSGGGSDAASSSNARSGSSKGADRGRRRRQGSKTAGATAVAPQAGGGGGGGGSKRRGRNSKVAAPAAAASATPGTKTAKHAASSSTGTSARKGRKVGAPSAASSSSTSGKPAAFGNGAAAASSAPAQRVVSKTVWNGHTAVRVLVKQPIRATNAAESGGAAAAPASSSTKRHTKRGGAGRAGKSATGASLASRKVFAGGLHYNTDDGTFIRDLRVVRARGRWKPTNPPTNCCLVDTSGGRGLCVLFCFSFSFVVPRAHVLMVRVLQTNFARISPSLGPWSLCR